MIAELQEILALMERYQVKDMTLDAEGTVRRILRHIPASHPATAVEVQTPLDTLPAMPPDEVMQIWSTNEPIPDTAAAAEKPGS